MKFLKWTAFILLILIIVYFMGPIPKSPVYSSQLPAVPSAPYDLETYVKNNEASHRLKPGNEARIQWFNDSLKSKTKYAVVYLHGFSASHEEGAPVHTDFARKYGCNLYLARLAEHGIDTAEPLAALTVDKLWNSAKEAYAIGKQLGEKVILMGCSTGGTLALRLAAEYPEIAALMLLSPNIAINDPAAWVLNNHWGLQAARMIKGKYNTSAETSAAYKKFWYHTYRMEGAVQLEELLETSMKSSVFEKVHQPLLLLYYFRDEEHQDQVVKVSGMKRMFRQVSTPPELKMEKALPTTGDHVVGSYIKSKDPGSVRAECEKFASDILKMPVVSDSLPAK
jgi:pimeloyl-ACP methyl ester carboxylesterase